MTLQDILSLLDKRYFNEDGSARVLEDEFRDVIASIRDLFKTTEGKALRGDWRAKLQSFTIRNGYVPEGMTNVDVQGSYVVGTRPKTAEDVLKRSKRTLGEQIYSRGLVAGVNATLKEIGFKHLPTEDYSDRASAMIALECDSISSKGPYDNGDQETAIKTVDGVLTHSAEYKSIPDWLYPAWEEGLLRRRSEYEQIIDRQVHLDIEHYVDYMQSRGLARTMRGFPFYASGNSKLRKQHYAATILMFSNVPGFKLTAKDASEFVGKLTVDQFIQTVLIHLFNELQLPMSGWYSLYHAIIIPISRDQGSPYKCEFNKEGELVWTGERKDRKYRLVTPISAYVQAALIMATRSLVLSAPKTNGRIGLQDPDTNDIRFNKFIHAAEAAERVIISTDFSSYDSTLSAQLMASMCAMYSTLFDDPIVKDCFIMAAAVACHKIMVLPTSTSESGKPYHLFPRELLPEIKGDKRFAARKMIKGLKGTSLKASLKQEMDKFDYMCQAFYICKGYLPSGLILTNTLGSDCTLLMSRELVPAVLVAEGVFPQPDHERPYEAIASGDDCAQETPKSVYDTLGYQKLLEAIEKAYAVINMIVNAKKQLKVLLHGVPLIDFLQKAYTQYDTTEFQKPYQKFLRQAPSLPYKERYSNLYQLLQWVIVWGKLDSALCEENLEFAASVMSHAGKSMNTDAINKGYKPPVPSSWYASRNTLFYDANYGIDKSQLAGLEQFIGLVKEYGQETLASIVRYDINPEKAQKLADEFDSELETRAPHRAQLAEQVFQALGGEFAKAIEGDERLQTKHVYVSFVPKFTALLEKFSGVTVNSQKLDQPKIGGEVQHDGIDSAEEDQTSADDYELG